MWACTTQRHYHPVLLTAFAQKGLTLLADPLPAPQFTPLVIASTMCIFAHHTIDEEDQVCRKFIEALAERAFESLENFGTQVDTLLQLQGSRGIYLAMSI